MDEIYYFRLALKNALKERGSQSNLAYDAGISEGYVSQLLSGKRINPSRRTLSNIAQALKKSYREMIDEGRAIAKEEPFHSIPASPRQENVVPMHELLEELKKQIDMLKTGYEYLIERDLQQEAHLTSHSDSIKKINEALRYYGETGDHKPLKKIGDTG